MNVAAKPKSLDWKKISLALVVLAIAGYQWYVQNGANPIAIGDDVATVDPIESGGSPEFKNPLETKPPSAPSDSSRQTGNSDSIGQPASREFLVSVGGRKLESPAGLIYGMGGGGEHRVDHVMRHSRDDPNRPAHGVFDGDQEMILKLLDEAYEMIKSKSKYVKSESSQGNMAYTITMGRKVGYEGGTKGKRNGNRALNSIRLVLDGDRVITAYPYR